MFKTLSSKALSFSRHVHRDSLYRNSIYLIASQVVLSGLGFLFWVLNARLFSTQDIGIATTLISISVMITNLSQMGFNNATIGYLPTEKNRQAFINTAFFIATLGASLLSVLFLIFVPKISASLVFLRASAPLATFFIISTIVSTLNAITDSIFIALRNTKYILLIDILVGLVKLSTPLFLIRFAAMGIFTSYVIAVLVGMLLSVLVIYYVFHTHFYPFADVNVIKRVWKFSSSSYLSNVVMMISSTITPILILNRLGANASAFYYMPSMIFNLMYTVPRSISSSMMAEGSSNPSKLLEHVKKSLSSAYLLLVPAILGVILFGKYVLLVFGKQYSDEGFVYLVLSSISMLFVIPNYVLGTILNIRKASKKIIGIGLISSSCNVLLVLYFIRYGLLGVGITNILFQVLLLAMYFLFTRSELIKAKAV